MNSDAYSLSLRALASPDSTESASRDAENARSVKLETDDVDADEDAVDSEGKDEERRQQQQQQQHHHHHHRIHNTVTSSYRGGPLYVGTELIDVNANTSHTHEPPISFDPSASERILHAGLENEHESIGKALEAEEFEPRDIHKTARQTGTSSSDSDEEHEHELYDYESLDSDSSGDELQWLAPLDRLLLDWQLDNASVQHELQLRASNRATPLGLPSITRELLKPPTVDTISECSEPPNSPKTTTASVSSVASSDLPILSPKPAVCKENTEDFTTLHYLKAMNSKVSIDTAGYQQPRDQTYLEPAIPSSDTIDAQRTKTAKSLPMTFIVTVPVNALRYETGSLASPSSASVASDDCFSVISANDGGKIDLRLTISTRERTGEQTKAEKVRQMVSQVHVAVDKHVEESPENGLIDILEDDDKTFCASIRNFRNKKINHSSNNFVTSPNHRSSRRSNGRRISSKMFLSEIRVEDNDREKDKLIGDLRNAVRTVLNRSNLLSRPSSRIGSETSSIYDAQDCADASYCNRLNTADSAHTVISDRTARTLNSITSIRDDSTLDSLTDAVMLKVLEEFRQARQEDGLTNTGAESLGDTVIRLERMPSQRDTLNDLSINWIRSNLSQSETAGQYRSEFSYQTSPAELHQTGSIRGSSPGVDRPATPKSYNNDLIPSISNPIQSTDFNPSPTSLGSVSTLRQDLSKQNGVVDERLLREAAEKIAHLPEDKLDSCQPTTSGMMMSIDRHPGVRETGVTALDNHLIDEDIAESGDEDRIAALKCVKFANRNFYDDEPLCMSIIRDSFVPFQTGLSAEDNRMAQVLGETLESPSKPCGNHLFDDFASVARSSVDEVRYAHRQVASDEPFSFTSREKRDTSSASMQPRSTLNITATQSQNSASLSAPQSSQNGPDRTTQRAAGSPKTSELPATQTKLPVSSDRPVRLVTPALTTAACTVAINNGSGENTKPYDAAKATDNASCTVAVAKRVDAASESSARKREHECEYEHEHDSESADVRRTSGGASAMPLPLLDVFKQHERSRVNNEPAVHGSTARVESVSLKDSLHPVSSYAKQQQQQQQPQASNPTIAAVSPTGYQNSPLSPTTESTVRPCEKPEARTNTSGQQQFADNEADENAAVPSSILNRVRLRPIVTDVSNYFKKPRSTDLDEAERSVQAQVQARSRSRALSASASVNLVDPATALREPLRNIQLVETDIDSGATVSRSLILETNLDQIGLELTQRSLDKPDYAGPNSTTSPSSVNNATMSGGARVPLTLVEFDDSSLVDRVAQSQSQSNLAGGKKLDGGAALSMSTANEPTRDLGTTRERSISQYELRVMKSLEKLSVPHSLIEQARERMTTERNTMASRERPDYTVVQSMENLAAFSFAKSTDHDASKAATLTNGTGPNATATANANVNAAPTSAQQRSVIVRTQPAYRSLINLHNSATFSFASDQLKKEKTEPVHVELPSAKYRQRSDKLGPIQSSLPKSFEEFKKSLPNLAVLSKATAAPNANGLANSNREETVTRTAASAQNATPKSILKRATDGVQASAPITLLKLTADDFRSRKTDAFPVTSRPTDPAAVEARKKAEKDALIKQLAARELDKVASSNAKPPPVPTLPSASSAQSQESKSTAAAVAVGIDDALARPVTDSVCAFVRRKVFELTRLITLCDRNAVAVGEALRRLTVDHDKDVAKVAEDSDDAALNNAVNSALKRAVEAAANTLHTALETRATLRFITTRDDAFYPRCEAFLSKFTAHSDAVRIASQAARSGAMLFGNGVLLFVFPRLADIDAYLIDTGASQRSVDGGGLSIRAFVTYASVRDIRQQFISCAGIGVRTLADLACLYNPSTHFVLACAIYNADSLENSRRARLGPLADEEVFVDAVCKWQCAELHDDAKAGTARLASPRAASPKAGRRANRESELQLRTEAIPMPISDQVPSAAVAKKNVSKRADLQSPTQTQTQTPLQTDLDAHLYENIQFSKTGQSVVANANDVQRQQASAPSQQPVSNRPKGQSHQVEVKAEQTAAAPRGTNETATATLPSRKPLAELAVQPVNIASTAAPPSNNSSQHAYAPSGVGNGNGNGNGSTNDEQLRQTREARFMRVQRALRAYGVNLKDIEPRLYSAMIDYVERGRLFSDTNISFVVQSANGDLITYASVISVTSSDAEPLITRTGVKSAHLAQSQSQRQSIPTPEASHLRDAAAIQRASLPAAAQNGATIRPMRSAKITEL